MRAAYIMEWGHANELQSGCGCVPVVEDTEHRKVVGVVTERDVCCGVAAPVAEARRKLHKHQATSLPAVDGAGCCCGTVNASSLGVRGLG